MNSLIKCKSGQFKDQVPITFPNHKIYKFIQIKATVPNLKIILIKHKKIILFKIVKIQDI